MVKGAVDVQWEKGDISTETSLTAFEVCYVEEELTLIPLGFQT